VKLIPLTQGKSAQVDDADFDFLNQFKWFAYKSRATYYARRTFTGNDGKRVTVLMHRVLTKANGHEKVDHEDHNGLNNQRSNLRVATNAQNCRNKGFYGSRRIKGVSAKNRRWTAQIRVNYKSIYLGIYDTQGEAAAVYDAAAIRYFGEFACTNESLGLLPKQQQQQIAA
jgi:hypothetical protein